MTPLTGPVRVLRRGAGALLRALFRLFPRPFRTRFGEDAQVALEMRLDEAAARGAGPLLTGTVRTAADLLSAAAREHLRPTVPDAPTASPSSSSSSPEWLMDTLVQDIHFAVRSLLRRPGFTFVALFTLAVGIGANTAVFSVVNGVLLRPLPYPESEKLVMVWSHEADEPDQQGWLSLPDLRDLRTVDGFEALEGWQGSTFTVTEGGAAERVGGARVSGGMLEVFGLSPLLGRDILAGENVPDGPRVVVVSHDFWQGRLGAAPDVVGSTLELSEVRYEIVGVAPPGFDFPHGARLWVPYRHNLEGCDRGCRVYQAVGRLSGDLSPDAVDLPLQARARALEEEHPATNTDRRFRAQSLLDVTVGPVRTGLWILLGAVGLVLLIVCANLANLVLVRASGRRGEVAVRAALGASRARLVRQVLTESVVLAAAGGALGLVLSVGMLEGFRAVAPVSLPRMEEVVPDGSVLAFALLVSGIVVLLFGASPALRLARTEPPEHLAGASHRGGRREGRGRSLLIATEIAVSLLLLSGAGLLGRTLSELYQVDMGFQGREVLRFGVSLPGARYDTLPALAGFFDELEGRLAALPGVEGVGSSFGGPLSSGHLGGRVQVEGRPDPEAGEEGRTISIRPVTAGYFDALGLRLLRGRGIQETDRGGTEPVAVVNEAFVADHFPAGGALGQRVRSGSHFGWGGNVYRTVVGVVGDVRSSPTAEPRPAMYVPHTQFGPGFLDVYLRSGREVEELVDGVRRELRAMDPALVVSGVETMGEAIRRDAASTRFYLLLLGVFAGLAVLLASVGLYGVVAYAVSRRTREIGIRMALGAREPEITGMVARQAVVPVVGGVVVGVGAAVAGGRFLESLLFQVEPTDPLVLAGVTVLVVAVSGVALIVPVRRAMGVDPTEALRSE